MIEKCECGSTDFSLVEELGWSCYLEKGSLTCKNNDNEIMNIVCDKCGKEYNEDEFNSINFN